MLMPTCPEQVSESPMSTVDGFELDIIHGTADESMRVTYEDPGQRDEKLKLMNLLGDDETVVSTGTKLPAKRKSTSKRTSRTSGS